MHLMDNLNILARFDAEGQKELDDIAQAIYKCNNLKRILLSVGVWNVLLLRLMKFKLTSM